MALIIRQENAMRPSNLQRKVIGYLQDCHAMERQVYHMLNGLIATTHDPEVLERLKGHRQETQRQARLLRERLEALGSGPALTEDVPAMMTAWMKGLYDMVRADKPGKNARDAYVTEHVEIAAYCLLERLAERANDPQTAHLARALGQEERHMAQWIEEHWDRFIDLTLETDGLQPSHAAADGGLMGGGLLPALGWALGLGTCGYLFLQLTRSGSGPARSQEAASRARQGAPEYAGM